MPTDEQLHNATQAAINARDQAREMRGEMGLLRAENAALRAAIEDMRTTTQGYLEGAEWEHWKQYHAERFARALNPA